ncbi:hypothetical protein QJS04_geneDACA010426 [Acorus gramineus]|uniref:Uncharacterized protein n=1 Tax=Acorus gramineus TaxID=55184 RepID=A0AAV9A2D8_ACOGR|nr:hypothetical protein QJS04_geneDACA010426 [Acorus gramineus]
MGTEVLRPQNILMIERSRSIPVIIPRPHHHHHNHQRRRRGSPSPPPPPPPAETTAPPPSKNLVVGHVTILRRGESLDAATTPSNKKKVQRKKKTSSLPSSPPSDGNLKAMMSGTDRIGPDPAQIPRRVRLAQISTVRSSDDVIYAGSAFSSSPSPSALPLPRFSVRSAAAAAVDDPATMGLRRLLRIG